MTEVEKIQQYIDKTKLSSEAIDRYYMGWDAINALYSRATKDANKVIGTLLLAFDYGMAKGYRAAKAEGRHEQVH